jgi:drug/metabolite transporter (DMT)-like permease
VSEPALVSPIEPDVPSVASVSAARRRAYQADAGLVVVTLVWGSTFVVVKGALAGAGPFEFIAMRFGIACVALLILGHRRLGTLGRTGLRAGLVIGVFLLLGYGFQTTGLQFTTASKAGFITGLSILIVPLFAFAVLRHKIGIGIIAGIALAAVGMYLLSFTGDVAFGVGDSLVFACAVAFAAHIVSISAYAPHYDAIALSIVQTGFVAAAAAIVSIVAETPAHLPTTAAWFPALYTGLIGTAAVLGVQTTIQRFTTPSHAALIFSLEPVFAALFAYGLVGETLGVNGLIGGALILSGMVVAEIKR